MNFFKVEIHTKDIFERVNNHLAVIGSKLKTSGGDTDFSKFVISTSAKIIVEDYIREAINNIISIDSKRLLMKVIAPETGGKIYTILIFDYSSSDRSGIFSDMSLIYVVNYCISEYLKMINESSDKYSLETENSLSNIKEWLFQKRVPSCDVGLNETTGSCV